MESKGSSSLLPKFRIVSSLKLRHILERKLTEGWETEIPELLSIFSRDWELSKGTLKRKQKTNMLSKIAPRYSTVCHFSGCVPLLFWFPLHGCRCEPHHFLLHRNNNKHWERGARLPPRTHPWLQCFSFQDLIVFSSLPGTTSYLITRTNDPLTARLQPRISPKLQP